MNRLDDFDRRFADHERAMRRTGVVAAVIGFLWFAVIVAAVITGIVLAWRNFG